MDCFKNLAGKVVVITGASSGIGASTAVEFAKLGSRLALTGRNNDRLQVTVQKCIATGLAENDVISMIADLKRDGDIKSVVDATLKAFGTVHVLINNAGDASVGSISNSPVTTLDDMFALHVRSVYILTQLTLDHLKKNKGSVVNVSSIYSTRPVAAYTGYCVAKAAQDLLTRCMAQDLASSGIRVNSVNPAEIRTDMVTKSEETIKTDADLLETLTWFQGHKDQGITVSVKPSHNMPTITDNEFFRVMGPVHPLGRVGEAEEVARLIVFFASDAASFITGTNTPIDGGLSVAPDLPH